MKKKTIAVVLALSLILALTFALSPASASLPSAKATAQIAELNVFSASATTGDEVDWDSSDVEVILQQQIKTANNKDLFIDVSLLSGLYTDTTVKSKGGDRDTSGAAAAVLIMVEVDGVPAFPGWIVFEGRVQVLTAVLGGYFVDDVLTEEEIGLIIGTLSANSFNFIVPDLAAGTHTVTVKAVCVTGAFSQAGSAAAKAVIGLGSVVIEEVRMIQDEDAIVELP